MYLGPYTRPPQGTKVQSLHQPLLALMRLCNLTLYYSSILLSPSCNAEVIYIYLCGLEQKLKMFINIIAAAEENEGWTRDGELARSGWFMQTAGDKWDGHHS